MSGEAVVVSVPIAAVAVAGPVLLAGAAIAGTALVGAIALKGIAVGVGAVIEHQAREARRRAEEERARIAEWQAFEQRQRAAMAVARERHDAIARMQQRLMAVQLREPVIQTAPAVAIDRRRNDTTSSADLVAARREAVSAALDEIMDALGATVAQVLQHPDSPVPSLKQQVERYRRQLADTRQPPPEAARIATLKQTAEQSIARFLQRLEAEEQASARRIERADAALKLLLVLEQLPRPELDRLRSLRQSLLPALAAGEISAAVLDRVEHDLQTAAQTAAERMASTALRPALAERLLRRLEDMGYEILSAFPDTWADIRADTRADTGIGAQVRIPGGEQVAIRMDEDARLRFNLMHESSGQQTAPLTQAEIDLARAQEQRWCKDLKTLVNRLTEDGFDSQITFERTCVTIPTVIVERFSQDQSETQGEPHHREETHEERRRRIQQAEQRKQRRSS